MLEGISPFVLTHTIAHPLWIGYPAVIERRVMRDE